MCCRIQKALALFPTYSTLVTLVAPLRSCRVCVSMYASMYIYNFEERFEGNALSKGNDYDSSNNNGLNKFSSFDNEVFVCEW